MGESYNKSPQELLSEIKELGNTPKASEKLKELIENHPEFIPARIELGLIYRRQGKKKLALETFTEAIASAPNNIRLRLELAREQFNLGQIEHSRQNIDQILAEKPEHVPALIKLGEIYRREQEREKALETFRQVLELNPQAIWGMINLGIELIHIAKYDEAEEQLKKALESAPNNFQALLNLGHIERQRNSHQQALEWYEQCSQQARNLGQTTNAQLCIAEELRDLQEIEKAIEVVEPILERAPKNLRARLIYGALLKKQANWETAIALYRETITMFPRNLPAHLGLADCLLELHQVKAAQEVLTTALEYHPRSVPLLIQIGHSYRRQEDRRQALQYYQKALEIEPKSLPANLDVAIELSELNDLDAARSQLETALEYHPDNFHVLIQISRLEQKRQPEIALEYLEKAIALFPERLELYGIKLEILLQWERFTEAKECLKQLEQQYHDNFYLLQYCGELARGLSQRTVALNWFSLAKDKANNSSQLMEAEICATEELRELGRFEAALGSIEGIIQKYPEYTRLQMLKGSILQEIPNLSAAAEVYENIISTVPNNPYPRVELARVNSKSGKIEEAIALLLETYRQLGGNIQVLKLLGQLNQAQENWLAAGQWYREICTEYPHDYQGYCLLADLFSTIGEPESALDVLKVARTKISHSVHILLKLIQIQMFAGNLDLSHQILFDGLEYFPQDFQLLLQLGYIYNVEGNYDEALNLLDGISTDCQHQTRLLEALKGNVYFNQYNYPKAEAHLRKAIALAPTANEERERLAIILMLTGRIEEASQELKIATEAPNLQTSPGKMTVPLRSQGAMMIHEIQINPPLMAKLQTAQQTTGYARIVELANLVDSEPNYLGSSLYLAKELRQQGVFTQIKQELGQNATDTPQIPKRIVQFWNELEPPEEVLNVCQSWKDLNPDYEYIRFSLSTAVAFLHQHYDAQVFKAFVNCDRAATQSDFFRLAYLNKMGGFYVDVDDMCRESIHSLVAFNPELVVLQEETACIGNNFIGCIPEQSIISAAFEQAVENMTNYSNESPWSATGSGLITSKLCSHLVPYLIDKDEIRWPRISVLSQAEVRQVINPHLPLTYKRTNQGWQYQTDQQQIKISAS